MISNNLNAKTKGDVVIVRQPHQFKPTVHLGKKEIVLLVLVQVVH